MYNHLGEQQNDSPPNDDSSSTSSLSDASVNSTHPAQVDLIPLHLSSSPDRYALSSEPQPQLDESSTIVTTLHMQKINQQLTNINSLKQSLVDDSHADAASAPFPLVSGDQHHVDDLSKSSATTSDDFVERLTLKLYQHAHSPRQTLVPSNLLPSQKTSDCPTVPDLLCEHSPSRVDMSQSNRPNTPTLPSAGAPSGAVGPADVSQIHQGLSLPVESRSTSTDTNLLGPDPPSPSTSRQRSGTPDAINTMYRIKWIRFHHQDRPIVTQNQNGPCPLLAIINILLLRGKFEFLNGKKNVTGEQLINMLADCIEDSIPNNLTPEAQLNYEQNMLDAMATFPKLSTGLDVNVKFDAIGSFEFTSELIVFDLLAIQLYHGWLVGPEEYELQAAIGHCSYNQLVEKIISNKTSNRAELVAEGRANCCKFFYLLLLFNVTH